MNRGSPSRSNGILSTVSLPPSSPTISAGTLPVGSGINSGRIGLKPQIAGSSVHEQRVLKQRVCPTLDSKPHLGLESLSLAR